MVQDPVKVVLIIGNQRSGSTLLGNLLGELDGFFNAGELHNLWERSLMSDSARCGCGDPVAACPLWSQVMAQVLDADVLERAESDPGVIRQWQRQVLGRRSPSLLRGRSFSNDIAMLEEQTYLELMARLYRSIAQLTGAHVIVDTSKSAAYAATMGQLSEITPSYIHLVRDPRGIVYSRQRGWKSWQRRGDEAHTRLDRLTVCRVASSWVRSNIAAERLTRRSGKRWPRVRYEDLVARPQEHLQDIVGRIGEAPATLPFEDARTARLGVQHTAAGNPSRFRTGTLVLREDIAWRTALPTADQWLTCAIAFPLMRRYGYTLRPGPHGHGG